MIYEGTVKSKIESEKYASIDEIATDIRLVFTNCMLYNKDGSEVMSYTNACDWYGLLY